MKELTTWDYKIQRLGSYYIRYFCCLCDLKDIVEDSQQGKNLL